MDLCQQFACSPDKRFALHVFIGAGCFADKHQLCCRVANPKDHSMSKRDQVGTFGARKHPRPQIFERMWLAAFLPLRRLTSCPIRGFNDFRPTGLENFADG
jgi:hypothetical protein